MSVLPIATASARLRVVARKSAMWLLLATLAWAPFPLGGAIAWASGLQEMLIAACWLLWTAGTWGPLEECQSDARMLVVPFALAGLALAWATLQMLPIVPAEWAHPIWGMASEVLQQPVAATISLDPWLTEGEILKLSSYVMAGYLAFQISQRAEGAKLLLNGVILIGAAYATYAFVLAFAGMSQTKMLYSLPYKTDLISGPFMLHNSFATYSGLATVAAMAKLFAKGERAVAYNRGWRRLAHDTLNFCFGSGVLFLVVAILAFAGVMASASRAGFAATICGLVSLTLAGALIGQGKNKRWTAIGALAVVVPLLLAIGSSGDTLFTRIGWLFASDAADPLRFSLWNAALRMIADAPLLGLGLGTFEDTYPLYASQVFPFVLDKAHCDYLEFAAGLGLPAAIAWWAALAWLFGLCLRGLRRRRRDRVYCAVAVGATVLVAVHSSVDFSLQLPAVALTYAVLMGVGVAQSHSKRSLQYG